MSVSLRLQNYNMLLLIVGLWMVVVTAALNIPSQSVPVRIVGTKGTLFVDELGRSRILHGTNVVFKGPPYIPDISANALPKWSFNQVDIDILASHGVTVIRLGVMWPGVEPVRGEYNQTYLDIVKSIIQSSSDNGIYVLLDMHQDMLSEKFCGEGVPLWAAQPDTSSSSFKFPSPLDAPTTLNSDGIPSQYCQNGKFGFPLLQSTFAAASAYQRLYNNYDGLRDSFAEFWKVVAQTVLPFKNILGFNLMNEPYLGDSYKLPNLTKPGIADLANLQPFYEAAAKAIRSVDSNAIIFFDSISQTNTNPVGFTQVPGGPGFESKSVLSFHYYHSPPSVADLPSILKARFQDMERLGAGGMLTEFEMGWQNGKNVEEIRIKTQIADENLLSYTGWEYTDYIPITGTNNGLRDPISGNVRPDMAKVYSRTYATAIPGTPKSMKFQDDTALFKLLFIHDGSSNPLEIRLNKAAHYPNGIFVSITGEGSSGMATLNSTTANTTDSVLIILSQAVPAGSAITVTVGDFASSSPNSSSTSSSSSQVPRNWHVITLIAVVGFLSFHHVAT